MEAAAMTGSSQERDVAKAGRLSVKEVLKKASHPSMSLEERTKYLQVPRCCSSQLISTMVRGRLSHNPSTANANPVHTPEL
jgi:hypothetical protein